eukprot:3199919-Pleurochrysis_carterae.AAC.1
MMLLCAKATNEEEHAPIYHKQLVVEPRRVVVRSEGGWRGSCLAGYVFKGDDKTYLQNFRMSRDTFECLVILIEDGGNMSKPLLNLRLASAHAARDTPTVRFK